MPHVVISCFKIEVDYEKLDIIQNEISKVLHNELGCDMGAISIDLKMIEPNNWKNGVYMSSIKPRMEYLIKKPEYTYK
ncbi:tautomerase PptA [Xenorhabdus bovienii]|uniref:tautomerase PptA n=1 Tax=Xenorhabdus bovienii TaxID=40576 RepID=UPI0023B235AC|nr:tautomerase PptA [Xenorhabdus bovienii]MDE9545510.1 tautomerase PptA [Xenorhabdus bovienii]MDE9566715.1 tautomerase PptA [Xenorhabdus bovienii]